MNWIAVLIQNPVKIAVGVIMVALFGTIALMRMPMQLTPEVQIPTITIETSWPGASPQEIEREIIQEQEEQLKAVEGVTKMSSESMDSRGTITLEFAVETDMSEALLMVNTRLNQVPEYPEDVDEPVIATNNSNDRPIAWFVLSQRLPTAEQLDDFARRHPSVAADISRIGRTANPGLALHRLRELKSSYSPAVELMPVEIDIDTLRKFMEDNIESAFERVEGVANANVFGGREEELQVIVDPQQLAARRLTIANVREALRMQNEDTSGGDFWEGKRRYVVRTLGQFHSPADVENMIVARREGSPVYIKDVAEVQLGFKKPDGMVRRFGGSSIAVNVQRRTGANVLDVMVGLRKANLELNEGILKQRGLTLTQVYDETEYIDSAIALAESDVYLGGVLTVIALLIFLRSARSTLIIAIAIPTTLLGCFIALNVLGRTFNVLSLAGLTFAVGMFVDNFIVVLENIFRHYQMGEDRITAAVNGTKEVWGAVFSATVANMGVFVPVLLVEGEAGQLFRDVAIAVSAGLVLSLFVALFMIPTATSRILQQELGTTRAADRNASWNRGRGESKPPFLLVRPIAAMGRSLGRGLDSFGSGFVRGVVGMNAWAQRGIVRSLAALAILIGGSVAVSYALLPGVEYLPQGNRNLVFGILLPPPGYNLNQLASIGQRIENDLRPYWDHEPGEAQPAHLKYPLIGDFFYVARGRMVFMGLRAEDPLRAGELVPLIQEVARDIPGTFAVAKQSSLFEQGLTSGRTVDIEITGPDIRRLVALGAQVMTQVRGVRQEGPNPMQIPPVIPGAQVIPKPSLDLSNPEVHLIPKWEQAGDMGVTAADLGYAVDALVDGAYASDYHIGGDKIDLSIVGNEEFASRTQDLETLPISTPTGHLVPLSALAEIRLSSGPEQINRRERQRAITIEVTPPLDMPLESAMQKIETSIIAPLQASGELGGLYQINLGGTVDKLRSTWLALRFNLLLALLITYLLMAALFESWLYPLVIILSVPLGAAGAFIGLALLNLFVLQPLDVMTMLGFVILVGTVVNNPILIIHQSLNHMREDDMSPNSAILESVRTRIRPIFMTTLTTIVGLFPLVLFPGAGSELYRGLGAVLLGGLVVSTVFTLILVPTLFSLTMRAKAFIVGLFGRRLALPHVDETSQPVGKSLPKERPALASIR